MAPAPQVSLIRRNNHTPPQHQDEEPQERLCIGPHAALWKHLMVERQRERRQGTEERYFQIAAGNPWKDADVLRKVVSVGVTTSVRIDVGGPPHCALDVVLGLQTVFRSG